MKSKLSILKKADREFQNNKIVALNKFFMRNIIIQTLLLFFLYTISIIFLIVLIKTADIDNSLKISLISMIATFILTTSKGMLEKIIMIIKFLISLLGEEQRGLNKSMGIQIDKIDFDNPDSHESSS
ncbi:MAG TPA: hypothetical protein PKV66_04395 [Candidatus Pelethenecus sp.]|nr:hypothetical protein [Candidatus Pelethenecus sp.]